MDLETNIDVLVMGLKSFVSKLRTVKSITDAIENDVKQCTIDLKRQVQSWQGTAKSFAENQQIVNSIVDNEKGINKNVSRSNKAVQVSQRKPKGKQELKNVMDRVPIPIIGGTSYADKRTISEETLKRNRDTQPTYVPSPFTFVNPSDINIPKSGEELEESIENGNGEEDIVFVWPVDSFDSGAILDRQLKSEDKTIDDECVGQKSYSDILKRCTSNRFSALYDEDAWTKHNVFEKWELNIDWSKEEIQRSTCQNCLTFVSVSTDRNVSYEHLEKAIRDWAGKWVLLKVLKRTMNKDGKLEMNVQFKDRMDRDKLYALRHLIEEDGVLSIRETLTDIQKAERQKMFATAMKLLDNGHDVTYESQRINVDNVYWRYVAGGGWFRWD